MEIKKEVITTVQSLSELFLGYDDERASMIIHERFVEMMNYPYQPERSKREDSHCFNCFELEKAVGNGFSQDGICTKCGRFVRCGALNIVETQ